MSLDSALAPDLDTHPDSTRSTHGVVVVGSANVDSVFSVSRIPKPGETVLAQSEEASTPSLVCGDEEINGIRGDLNHA